jgi:hypothetical protein
MDRKLYNGFFGKSWCPSFIRSGYLGIKSFMASMGAVPTPEAQ